MTDLIAAVFSAAPLSVGSDMVLDTWHEFDIEWLFNSMQDPDIMRLIPGEGASNRDNAAAWPGIVESRRRRGLGLSRVIRVEGHPVGSIDIHRVDWLARSAELSYWTEAPSRRRGYMTSAVAGLSRWLLDTQHFQRIELRMTPDNIASVHVARHCGFQREGVARNAAVTHEGRVDVEVYSLIPSDLAADAT